MTAEELINLLDRPEIAGIRLFGSCLYKDNPDDVDVLIIYHVRACPHHVAHKMLRATILELQLSFDVPLHVTVLSDVEIAHNDFIDSEDCIPLVEILGMVPGARDLRIDDVMRRYRTLGKSKGQRRHGAALETIFDPYGAGPAILGA